MVHPSKPPNKPGDDALETELRDPKTGESVRYADLRSEFSKISRQVPRNVEAERAFILSKIEMIRSDPHLSEDEKQRAITDLKKALP